MCEPKEPQDGKIEKGRLALEGMKHAFLGFERRRSYEWKLNLAIWTAIAVFMGLIFKGEIETEQISDTVPYLWLIGAGIALVHLVFLLFACAANNIDRNKANAYEKAFAEAADVTLPPPKKGAFGFRGYWAPVVETMITILLLIAAGLIIAGRLKVKV